MEYLVTGSLGQLGSEICRQLGDHAALGVDLDDLDLTDRAAVVRLVGRVRPRVILHTAAMTNVDGAEDAREACWAVNADTVKHLAELCREWDATLVQLSTDYVFGADAARSTPYREDDPAGPQGVYAESKLAAEQFARQCPRHFIVRTCGLYGPASAGRSANNFVETMLRLAETRDSLRIVDDQVCTPTFTGHLARAILYLAGTEQYGTYHVTNRGSTTWYDFAAEVFRLAQKPVRLERISSIEYGARAPRPAYSVLDTSKYHALGGPAMPPWQDAVREYLESMPDSK